VADEEPGGHDPTLSRKRLAAAYRDVAASPAGESVLAHLYAACAQGKSSVSTGWDPMMIAFREGARSIWLEIEDLLEYSPEADAARRESGAPKAPRKRRKPA
jgi:hypothetical protein